VQALKQQPDFTNTWDRTQGVVLADRAARRRSSGSRSDRHDDSRLRILADGHAGTPAPFIIGAWLANRIFCAVALFPIVRAEGAAGRPGGVEKGSDGRIAPGIADGDGFFTFGEEAGLLIFNHRCGG